MIRIFCEVYSTVYYTSRHSVIFWNRPYYTRQPLYQNTT